ncbi:unnamed protein product [Paramecium pentaurelia]|uniref:Tetratricopeptide repeat protein n=1 Tax=Paramecium pentaurelia TaxID=43138 RepID=A0A8S1RX01_9CILI|nr:unnamed protein product [Paramecium pentaurelia]
MCTHLQSGQESQSLIVICENEDCHYKYHPQCMKCSFKICQKHLNELITGEKKIIDLFNQLQLKYEQMEKLAFNLNQSINKCLTKILSHSRLILNQIQQFIDNGLFQDVIPLNFNIDYILDILDEINKEIQNKFQQIEVYIYELSKPQNLYQQKQSKIYQKRSILFEQEDHLQLSLEAINISLNMNSLSLFSIYQKGNILFKQNQFEESLKYLLKVFFLSKQSKKKELKFQIYITLQENCLFKMKQYNYLINLSNTYQKEFDYNNVSMLKSFALFNQMQYEQALNSLNEIKIDKINHVEASKFKDICEQAQKSIKDQKEKSNISFQQEILQSSISHSSQIKQGKKNSEIEIQNTQTNQIGTIVNLFKQTLFKLATILFEQDDEKCAFLQQNNLFLLEMKGNKISIVDHQNAHIIESQVNFYKVNRISPNQG